ncbi:HK97 family phage prohead protease [Tumebacillus permanentifrigoris]|uniref:Prohead peptidase n=1 Tax=Tumebacillus permanentifrigoris TaxID=378543 RepID=A0A316D4S1_9BACL|nr:HK97 family phage prohead protease [Tumebacillus permanentifrigoris]PWK05308.1 prohead peptidase [Tumebacillus permanentifrigoris]
MEQKPTPQRDENQNEIRTLAIHGLNTRAKGEAGTMITGYAAVYDEYTEIQDWWGDTYFERIAKDAIVDTLGDGHDIFALKNHNWNAVVGRTGANLVLENQQSGLYFEVTPNNSTLGRDMLEDVNSGLIKGCSIGFKIREQIWESKDDLWYRTITKLDLFEITLTPIPAYTSTTAEVRSLVPGNNQIPPETRGNTDEMAERQAILANCNRILETIKGE